MMLTKRIAESYLIKATDTDFPDALRQAIKKDWIPWGEPTFIKMGSEKYTPYVMVYLMMVKFEPTKLAVRHQKHVEDGQ